MANALQNAPQNAPQNAALFTLQETEFGNYEVWHRIEDSTLFLKFSGNPLVVLNLGNLYVDEELYINVIRHIFHLYRTLKIKLDISRGALPIVKSDEMQENLLSDFEESIRYLFSFGCYYSDSEEVDHALIAMQQTETKIDKTVEQMTLDTYCLALNYIIQCLKTENY